VKVKMLNNTFQTLWHEQQIFGEFIVIS